MHRWLDHSRPLRERGPGELRKDLWIGIQDRQLHGSKSFAAPTRRSNLHKKFVQRHGLTFDDGTPLLIHRGRIRATYLNLLSRRRGWTGRTTIDPNHTAAVEGDHYLTAATPVQREAVESIIEDGQADMLRKAKPPTVLSDEELATAVAEFPKMLADNVDDAAMLEMVGGQRDVFVAACADQLAGQWRPAGQPCPARPWVCLLCPLAVFMPRHAPNLLRLKAFFARQFHRMPSDQFVRVFGAYADRLNTDILPRFAPEMLAHAATTVADDDHEIPLRAEERTA